MNQVIGYASLFLAASCVAAELLPKVRTEPLPVKLLLFVGAVLGLWCADWTGVI